MTALRVERCLPDGFLAEALRADARAGLSATPKVLPPKWFYDERGSELFEKITRLDEYYPTRAERSILRAAAGQIAAATRARTLVELGAGAADKTRLLLDALAGAGTLASFVPVDVSETALIEAARRVDGEYPGLAVTAVVSDFEEHLGLPEDSGRRLVVFLGGTIGNLLPGQRAAFLASLRSRLRPGDAFLLGTDLVKDPAVLVAAYDDAAGVTAAFNKNILSVLNAALGANFDPDAFEHVALWDAREEWIEMRLRSLERQLVTLPAIDLEVTFGEGEEMRTEVSAKFRRERVAAELAAAGFTLAGWWTDEQRRFGLSLSVPGLKARPLERAEPSPRSIRLHRAAVRASRSAVISSPATRSAAIVPQLNRSTAIRFSSGQVWMARCDSARMSTRVTAPFGKITWLESSTVPPPACTAAVAAAVSSAMSETGEPGVSAASTVQSCLGTGTVAADEGGMGRRVGDRPGASFPGMMGEDTRWPAAGRGQPSRAAPAWDAENSRNSVLTGTQHPFQETLDAAPTHNCTYKNTSHGR